MMPPDALEARASQTSGGASLPIAAILSRRGRLVQFRPVVCLFRPRFACDALPVSLPHHPSAEQIARWPVFSAESPLRVLTSGCLFGLPCGVDGTSYGDHPLARYLLSQPVVKAFPFCPEDRAFGTPRKTPNVHGGTGFDVLDGRARVHADTDEQEDMTAPLARTALEMAEHGKKNDVHVALMMDVSGACGSTVIYDGRRLNKKYRAGPGVAGAAVMRAGILIVSQRDERTLRAILEKLGAAENAPFTDGLDHHDRDWYRGYFGRA
jgi:uncharacterized protein YbbK (DUF523 family)